MRVLIVRIGAMGDVLHAMPAVAALRERHPDWFIGWAIEPRWSDLLQITGDPDDLSQGVKLTELCDEGRGQRWWIAGTAWRRANGDAGRWRGGRGRRSSRCGRCCAASGSTCAWTCRAR